VNRGLQSGVNVVRAGRLVGLRAAIVGLGGHLGAGRPGPYGQDASERRKIAGIQAAKQTSALIPLCHPLPLHRIDVSFVVRRDGIAITAEALTIAKTGVEMEALTAASVAALTIYDMCKAVDKTMTFTVSLQSKTKGDVA